MCRRSRKICAPGWRDTYAVRHSRCYIEEVIAEFYNPERLASEVGGERDGWGGYVVAELDGEVLVAGGGLIAPGEGELFVLYAHPAQRRRGGGSAVLRFITEQQRLRGARKQWVSVDLTTSWGSRSIERTDFH